MTPAIENGPVLAGRDIRKTFRRETGESRRSTASRSPRSEARLTALVGPDGAGKTTLMRLIAGLMTADAGELDVLGIDVAARSAAGAGSASATCRSDSACTRT